MSPNDCKIVIGANSFIGKNLTATRKLNSRECNLLDKYQTRKVLERQEPTTIVNCAALHGSSRVMAEKHSEYLVSNLQMNINLLQVCNDLRIQNVLLLGSISGFPDVSSITFKEDDLYKGPVNPYNLGYNSAKRFLVELAQTFQIDFARNYKVVHLGNIYGPHSKFNQRATVVSNVIFRIDNARRASTDVIFEGDGEDLRALTYVRDLDQLLFAIAENDSIREPMIISSTEVTNIKNLTEIISRLLGFKGRIIFNGEKGGRKSKIPESSYFRKYFPDFAFTNLEIGLEETVQWFKNNQQAALAQ